MPVLTLVSELPYMKRPKGRENVSDPPSSLRSWPSIGMEADDTLAQRREATMLVLSRKLGEKICIGENICITVVDIDRGKIRLGIEAPRNVPIYRQETLPLKNNDTNVSGTSTAAH